MTPTEKKYRNNLGKLFIVRNRRYNQDKHKFELEHGLCMVYGMMRTGYRGDTGAYAYKINTLSEVDVEWMKDYNVRCTEFINGSNNYWTSRTYVELTEENKNLVGTIIDLDE